MVAVSLVTIPSNGLNETTLTLMDLYRWHFYPSMGLGNLGEKILRASLST
jgi:hypothetical protein